MSKFIISSGETAQAFCGFPASKLEVLRGIDVLATNVRILVIFALICVIITGTQKYLAQLMRSTGYYLLPSTRIFFTLVFGSVLLMKHTMNLREMPRSFCMPLNFLKMENAWLLFQHLLKIGCIQLILSFLWANSIPENVCVLLMLRLCCLREKCEASHYPTLSRD